MIERSPKTKAITVKQLKEFIKDWPDEDQFGEPSEVWVETAPGLSNGAGEIGTLNQTDIYIEPSHFRGLPIEVDKILWAVNDYLTGGPISRIDLFQKFEELSKAGIWPPKGEE